MLSHTYIKKINLSLPKILSKSKNLDITCIAPKKIFKSNKVIHPDYINNEIKIRLIKSN